MSGERGRGGRTPIRTSGGRTRRPLPPPKSPDTRGKGRAIEGSLGTVYRGALVRLLGVIHHIHLMHTYGALEIGASGWSSSNWEERFPRRDGLTVVPASGKTPGASPSLG